jgi:hypothetical protein
MKDHTFPLGKARQQFGKLLVSVTNFDDRCASAPVVDSKDGPIFP